MALRKPITNPDLDIKTPKAGIYRRSLPFTSPAPSDHATETVMPWMILSYNRERQYFYHDPVTDCTPSLWPHQITRLTARLTLQTHVLLRTSSPLKASSMPSICLDDLPELPNSQRCSKLIGIANTSSSHQPFHTTRRMYAHAEISILKQPPILA